MRDNSQINEASSNKRLRSTLAHDYAYLGMKIFSRIYLFKRIYLFFSRLSSRALISSENNLICDKAVELKNNFSVSEVVETIKKDGFCSNIQLNQDLVDDILEFSESNRCYAYGDSKWGFYLSQIRDCEVKLDKKILIANYLNYQEKNIFNNFINSPVLTTIAKQYLGNSARNIATQLWWTFPADVDAMTRSKAAHYFHRDVDAWAFIKFFFYITPVEEGGGPHVYVKGSHRPHTSAQIFKEKLLINRHDDTSIRARFGDDSISPIYGTGGAGIIADTFGFHKGESPEKNPRLMLCAVYATRDYGEQEFEIDPDTLESYDA